MNSKALEDKLPFLPPEREKGHMKDSNEYLILMVGNSITRHGTNPEILEKYGWDHVSGMAASCEEKDYANLLARKIQETMPDKKVRLMFQDAGNEEQFKRVRDLSLRPDLIVFQCGEHVTTVAVPQFEQMYTQTIECFRESHPEVKIITIGIWNPCCYEEFTTCTGLNYSENAKLINAIQKRVSAKFGIPFADVSPYENDQANTGTGVCAPVRWHPNDNGMRCYANTAFEAFLE